MRDKGIAATCLPVQFDDDRWETAFFLHVEGPESKQDRRILKMQKTTPTELGVELLKHASAAVVMMRLEVQTIENDPLVFEILLVPGLINSHYESIKVLAQQQHIRYFFSDSDFRILQQQEQQISETQHQNFESLARESFAHDSVVRMAGKYDGHAALSEIVSHYQVRTEPGNPSDKQFH